MLFGERKSAEKFVEKYVATGECLDELDDQAPTWSIDKVVNVNSRRTRHAVTFVVSEACDAGAVSSDLARKVSAIERAYLDSGDVRTYGWKLHDGTEGTFDSIVVVPVERLARWQEKQRELEATPDRPVRGGWSS